MRQQNVIIFSSGKNKRVAHEIAWGLDGGVCKAVVWDEFFNKIYGEEYTFTKSYALFPFLVKKIPSFDYAIIVAGDDDRMRKNDAGGHEYVTARDLPTKFLASQRMAQKILDAVNGGNRNA